MANLSALEDARFEEFSDDEAVRESMAKAYVPRGEYVIKFRAVKAGKNPTVDKEGEPISPERHPGENNITALAIVDGTDVRMNVTFTFIEDKSYKPWLMWANVLKALDKPVPRSLSEYESIVEVLETEGLRWRVSLCATRGEEFKFVSNEEQAKELGREGYEVFNYMDKKANSARRV